MLQYNIRDTSVHPNISKVVWSLESDRKCVGGFGGYLEFGVVVSIVLEYRRMVGTELEES